MDTKKMRFIKNKINMMDRDTKFKILQTVCNHGQKHLLNEASNGQGLYIDLNKLSPVIIDAIHHLIEKRINIRNE